MWLCSDLAAPDQKVTVTYLFYIVHWSHLSGREDVKDQLLIMGKGGGYKMGNFLPPPPSATDRLKLVVPPPLLKGGNLLHPHPLLF